MNIGIVIIGVGEYLKFFNRLYNSIDTNFASEWDKNVYLFSDNAVSNLPSKVKLLTVATECARNVKLNKFHYINTIIDELEKYDYVFYFDADNYVGSPISSSSILNWFHNKSYVGVMHPWMKIRENKDSFETDPKSAAYIADVGDFPYHQSCFWGCVGEKIKHFVSNVTTDISYDVSINHINSNKICDEIYVNKYFHLQRNDLYSLDTEYANPGEAYKTATGYLFNREQIIIHDNANQTRSDANLPVANISITCGAFLQVYTKDLAVYKAIEAFRNHNPNSPIFLQEDGGESFAAWKDIFTLSVKESAFRNGSWKNRHSKTNQYIWLERLYHACISELSGVNWVVILEPDVETFNPLTKIPKYSLNGPGNGPLWTEELAQFIRSKYPIFRGTGGFAKRYTGCGGSIVNRLAFISAFENTSFETLQYASTLDERILLAEDATLSFLLQISGYDTGGGDDFIGKGEKNYHEQKHLYAFTHGNKEHYGKMVLL